MIQTLYYYRLLSWTVHDGDSLKNCSIDTGFDVALHRQAIRLARIQAPELRSHPQGGAAKEFLAELLGDGPVVLYSRRWDKYRRILGEVWVQDGEEWINASDKLLEVGLAVPYGGG
jgi:endonuclease YncB( thermonuclease family)